MEAMAGVRKSLGNYALPDSNSEVDMYAVILLGPFERAEMVRLEVGSNGQIRAWHALGRYPAKPGDVATRIDSVDVAASLRRNQGLDEVGIRERCVRLRYAAEGLFWSCPDEDRSFGLDGYWVLVEGSCCGRHRVAMRWCPPGDSPLRAFAAQVLDFAGCRIENVALN